MQTKHRNSGSHIADHAQSAVEEIQSAGAAALDRVQELHQTAKNGVITGARAADKAIRQNPYPTIGIAFGVGLLIGFLAKRK